jgi:Tol biopolymer transport system component
VLLATASLGVAGAAPAAPGVPAAALAFSRVDVAGEGIYVLSGGRVRAVVRGAAEPVWSPDARRIAYVARGSGGASDLFVIDADGKHAGRITWTEGVDETSPSWSPDGKRLVFERGGAIVTVRADGAGEHRSARDGSRPGHPEVARSPSRTETTSTASTRAAAV